MNHHKQVDTSICVDAVGVCSDEVRFYTFSTLAGLLKRTSTSSVTNDFALSLAGYMADEGNSSKRWFVSLPRAEDHAA